MSPILSILTILFGVHAVAEDAIDTAEPGINAPQSSPTAGRAEKAPLTHAFEVVDALRDDVCADGRWLSPSPGILPSARPTDDHVGRFWFPPLFDGMHGMEFKVEGPTVHQVGIASMVARDVDNPHNLLVVSVAGEAVYGELSGPAGAFRIEGTTDGPLYASPQDGASPCGLAASRNAGGRMNLDTAPPMTAREASEVQEVDPPVAAMITSWNAEYLGTLDILYVYGPTMPAQYGSVNALEAVVGTAVTTLQAALDMNRVN